MKYHLLALFALLFPILLPAAFPPAYYPTGEHPRLWLTSERINAFQAAQAQNTQQWIDFKDLCDSLIDSDPDNDPWNVNDTPQSYAAPLALMYRLSNDNRYADRAMQLMDATPSDPNNAGYGNPEHENFHYLGLAYDWLYHYSAMSSAKKTAYKNKMNAISNVFWDDNNAASGTDSDNNLLTGMTHLILGAAAYEEGYNETTMLNRGWTGWSEGYGTPSGSSSARNMIKEALGGVYFTGMSYFPSTDIIGISAYQLTLKTACFYDINVLEPELKPFWANVIQSIIHLTEPTAQRIFAYASWQDPNILSEQSWMHQLIAITSYFAQQSGDSEQASRALGYAQDVDIGYHEGTFLEFFFNRPNAAIVSPYSNNLPLVYFSEAPGFSFFRTNWNDNANWGVFTGNGSIPFDHQAPDQGHFSLWHVNDYLTTNARNYDSMLHGDFFNALAIESNCEVNGVSCSGTALFNSEKSASITRHREQSNSLLFAYAMLEADGQWNDNPAQYEPQSRVKTYRRHFFWADNYSVVFDRLRTQDNTPLWSKYRLRALTEPVINGNTVFQLSANGEHKLLQRTLQPGTVSINKINEKTAWKNVEDWVVNDSERNWQTVIELPSATRINILNVIQTGASSMTNFDTLEHLNDTNNSGVRIGPWLVNFSPEEVLRSQIDYSIQNSDSNMWHFVADLEPGMYKVMANDTQIKQLRVKEGDNSALFQTTISSSLLNIKLLASSFNAVPIIFYLLN